MSEPQPGLAQFFFECGYTSCYADAIAYQKVEPWKLTDELIERSFVVSQEAYEDAAEYDRYRALADAAPDLYTALRRVVDTNDSGSYEEFGLAMDAARQVLARAGESA